MLHTFTRTIVLWTCALLALAAVPAANAGPTNSLMPDNCTHAYDVLCYGPDACGFEPGTAGQCEIGYCILYIGPGNCTTLDDITE